MIIEKLKDFERYHLSAYKLIYRHYTRRIIIIECVTILATLVSFVFFIFHLTTVWWLGLLPCACGLLFFYFYNKNKALLVIKDQYAAIYNIDLSKTRISALLDEVRLNMFRAYIQEVGITNKEKLQYVLEYLNSNHGATSYTYRLTETLAFVMIGAWLGGFISASLGSAKDFIDMNKLLILIGFAIMAVIIYVEKFLVKEIVLWRRNKHQRLKTLIYYHLTEPQSGK